MAQRSYLIIGNGIAGATAAEVLRTEDSSATITLVADDPCPVFYRPALKDYLGGKIPEEKLWARPIGFYPERRVDFITDRVVSIQPGEHTLQLQSGKWMTYSRLLLAQGAHSTSLTCPGANLMGVTTLRTVADYQGVLGRLNITRRIVVVGSGTLALESIETLRHRGYEVTHLLRRRTLWSEVLDPVASDLVLQQEKRDGVDIRTDQEVAEIQGRNGQVTGIITTTGQRIACEVVLLGIGIEPNIACVTSAGIACSRGVKVDSGMRTNVSDIYAAGDLIETTDPLTGKARVLGQWYPSIQQARAAAYSMLDLLDTEHLYRFNNFYNATFLYGLEFASVGLSLIPKGEKGYHELVADPKPRTYQKVIFKDGVPVGALALGDRRIVLALKRAIDHQVNLSSVVSRLFAADFNLPLWLDQHHVPPAFLGANREGAVAVQQVAYATRTKWAPTSQGAPKEDETVTMREAKLIPAPNQDLVPPLKTVYLSQTRVTTIGRQEGSILVVNDSTISRRHAEISYANGQYVLRDLGSKNGSAVNATRLTPNSIVTLKSGDQVQVGRVLFTFRIQQVPLFDSELHSRPHQGELMKSLVAAAQAMQSAPTAASKGVSEKAPAIQSLLANAQGQPTLSSDGSLFFPGATSPLASEAISTLRTGPALVAIVNGNPLVFPLPAHKWTTIGRDGDNDIVLPDISVSLRHAEIFHGLLEGVYIRDLQSANGVRINHNKITSTYRLAHGETIALGSLSLYFMHYQGQAFSPQEMDPVAQAPPMQPAAPGAPSGPSARIEAETVSCRQCGSALVPQARFCPHCGAPR